MRQLISIAAFFTLIAVRAPAFADVSIVATGVDPGQITMTLEGPAIRAADVTLRDARDPRSAAARATAVRSYADGDEPLALAIVYNGQEVYLGNDDIVGEDDPSRYFGALKGIARSIDTIAALRFPAGSEAALISYTDGIAMPLPMTRIERLRGSALGTQRDYYGKLGNELVLGIDAGLRQLEQSRAPIKALIVIGDGNDTNNDAAKQQLVELKRRAARDGIHTYALIYKGMLSDPGNVITTMVPSALTVSSSDHMAAALQQILATLTARSYVTFSGDNLAWDGREHAVIVSANGVELDREVLALPEHASASSWLHSHWWQQLGAGFGAVLLLALGLRATFRWRTQAT